MKTLDRLKFEMFERVDRFGRDYSASLASHTYVVGLFTAVAALLPIWEAGPRPRFQRSVQRAGRRKQSRFPKLVAWQQGTKAQVSALGREIDKFGVCALWTGGGRNRNRGRPSQMKPIRFSPHAEANLKEREIAREDAEAAIRNPART